MLTLTPFSSQVIDLIRSIPSGKVATYGQISLLAGNPHGARGVAWILHSCSRRFKLPWHRVINSKGGISFEKGSFNFAEQRRRLKKEGVVSLENGDIDLQRFKWTQSVKSQPVGKGAKTKAR